MLGNPGSPSAEMAVDYATYVLYRLTGEKYPGVSRTIESYIHNVDGLYTEMLNRPTPGRYVQVPTTISQPRRLYLRGTPVHEVLNVYSGNEILPETSYALVNKRFLLLHGGSYWNYGCNDGGVTVEYTYGMMPPKAGIMACTTLANELMLLLDGVGPDKCRIPERVRSVSREGISFDMIDPQEFLDDGRTGIWEVDLFIRTANPARAKKQPRIVSPSDTRRYRR